MQERLTPARSTSQLQKTSADYLTRMLKGGSQTDFQGFFSGSKPVHNQKLTLVAAGAINLNLEEWEV